jgi:hypothetical protein
MRRQGRGPAHSILNSSALAQIPGYMQVPVRWILALALEMQAGYCIGSGPQTEAYNNKYASGECLRSKCSATYHLDFATMSSIRSKFELKGRSYIVTGGAMGNSSNILVVLDN